MKIAWISDRFTYECFKYECEIIYLEPDSWKSTLKYNKPDLFFCESTWDGIDTVTRKWYRKIAWDGFERLRTLKKIISYCKKNQIPTVFYNKEDPIHFERFLPAAKLFDNVFTTAIEQIKHYKSAGIRKVHWTMFAVQPLIFNPIEVGIRKDQAVFAGSFYQEKQNRMDEQQMLFDKIFEAGIDLIIYNRQSASRQENYRVPSKYRKFVNPAIDYLDTCNLYKKYKYGININSVTKSESMFSRRVFELLATGTYVFSNESTGLEKHFKSVVSIVNRNSIISIPNQKEFQNVTLSGIRLVLKKHTYKIRYEDILKDIGIQTIAKPRKLHIIFTNFINRDYLENLQKLFNSDNSHFSIDISDRLHVSSFCDNDLVLIYDGKVQFSKESIEDMLFCYLYLPHDIIVANKYQSGFRFLDTTHAPTKNSILPSLYIQNSKSILTVENISIKRKTLFSVPREQI